MSCIPKDLGNGVTGSTSRESCMHRGKRRQLSYARVCCGCLLVGGWLFTATATAAEDGYWEPADACQKSANPEIHELSCALAAGSLSGAEGATLHLRRGMAFAGLDDYRRAIADYDRSILLDSNDAMAFKYRCLSRGKMGQLAGALDDCERSLAL